VESRLAHRLDPSRWSDCGCSGNFEPCSLHVHLQTNRHSVTCARRRGRTGGRRRWSSDWGRRRVQGSRCWGECIFIWQGAFLTMEHLLATMVSVNRHRGGCRPGAFRQWSTYWRRWLVYLHHFCRSGRLQLSFFI
jgi:hypothetical protein